jgi:hypothetical protein
LSLCSEIEIKEEAMMTTDPPLSLNLQKLSSRVRNQVEQKKRLVSTLGQPVEGQKLFLSLAKTLEDKVKPKEKTEAVQLQLLFIILGKMVWTKHCRIQRSHYRTSL